MDNNRNTWIDYLRSSLTVLVVAHHSALAYTTFASFDSNCYINSTSPIVDSHRSVALDIFENFNDIFFMSLMFFIGGLFLSKSIAKKGAAAFTVDRVCRLLIPFIGPGTLLMLIAYFPSFYLANHKTDLIAHVKDFFTTERWPVGPPWFIWVLFVFNLLFVLLYPLLRRFKTSTGLRVAGFQHAPVRLFMFLLTITWLLYVPLAYHVGAATWTGIGPFDFQLSRILLYPGYFFMGVIVGNSDFNNQIFSHQSLVTRRWWLWLLFAVVAYAVLTVGAKQLEQMVKANQLSPFTGWMIYYTLYAGSCTLSCLAFITGFRKFVISPVPWWTSLSDNAYLIYLVHYVFVTWIQFLLLKYDIPAFGKFLLCFVLAIILSWLAAALLRKIRLVRRYL